MTVYTEKGLADALGLGISDIRSFEKSGVIRKNGNCYILKDCAKNIINYYRNTQSGEYADYQNERALLARVKRKNAEMDLELRQKKLHTSEDVEFLVTQMLINFKSKLSALPSKLTPQLSKMQDSTEIYDLLKKSIDETLTELSDYDMLFGDENGST